MKTITAQMQAHLDTNQTTLAKLWKATLRDTTVIAFTDHDVSISYGGTTYLSTAGYTPTDVSRSSALNVDTMEMVGILEATGFTDADVLNGKLDGAVVEVRTVNWKDLTMGDIKGPKGWVGEVALHDGYFVAEVRSLAEALQQTIGKVTSATCRADFCDSECGLNVATYTFSGTVTTPTDNQDFTTSLTDADDFYTGGLLTWTSGPNNGLTMEVRRYLNTGGQVELVLPMPFAVAAGHGFDVLQACDKTITTCIGFSNAINFRGEPHRPNPDEVVRFGG